MQGLFHAFLGVLRNCLQEFCCYRHFEIVLIFINYFFVNKISRRQNNNSLVYKF